ncbi:carbonic anhydrase 2-like [Daphnia carinata]|uniref:carbonic anhydrase 2-like n=1 Tax=Daphnia carinata TaxID=120202 RepID=UPI00257FDE44|nr:carbonic anhydrase 2-like [Daphnia carinata]
MPVLFHAALADDAMAAAEGLDLSPIEILSQNAVRKNFPELKFWGYDSNVPLVVHNDGHSVKLSADNEKLDSVPYITGGSLDGRYKLLQLHFHWGCDANGSEHTIDGVKFAAEMHIVHQNQVFDSLQEAKSHRNGFAILTVMLKVQETENAILHPVIEGCRLLKGQSKEILLPSPLELFLPGSETRNCFFTYFGSLTTPPYNEVVTWIILKEPVGISLKQLEAFRTLQGIDGQLVLQNCSSSKNLNNRKVFSSF